MLREAVYSPSPSFPMFITTLGRAGFINYYILFYGFRGNVMLPVIFQLKLSSPVALVHGPPHGACYPVGVKDNRAVEALITVIEEKGDDGLIEKSAWALSELGDKKAIESSYLA